MSAPICIACRAPIHSLHDVGICSLPVYVKRQQAER